MILLTLRLCHRRLPENREKTLPIRNGKFYVSVCRKEFRANKRSVVRDRLDS